MSEQLTIRRRKGHKSRVASRPVRAALDPAFATGAAGGAPVEFPGLGNYGDAGDRRRTLVTTSAATAIHVGIVAILLLFASLAPVIDDEIIPVRILREEPPEREPAPAPKVLAERRALPYAPAIQSVQPQIVNPRVVADASPSVHAEAFDMEAVSSSAAPTQIEASGLVVERVSAVNSIARARASAVDVSNLGAPAVRGPVKINAPSGPSVGPRKVATATGGPSMGTGKLKIGGGSSVREGVASNRDVLGSPEGVPLVQIDTAIGEGNLRGGGGSGDGQTTGGVTASSCLKRPEVQLYMDTIHHRTLDRWHLPPGVTADQKVTLKFRLDVAGSASSVKLVRASNNSLGASAVDALSAAAPFPPMPEPVRCLSRVPIVATFSNPRAS